MATCDGARRGALHELFNVQWWRANDNRRQNNRLCVPTRVACARGADMRADDNRTKPRAWRGVVAVAL